MHTVFWKHEMGRASNRSEILELFSPSLDFKIRCKSTCAIKAFQCRHSPAIQSFVRLMFP